MSSQSIYVAGAWIHRDKLKMLMLSLKEKGYDVVSGWIERENTVAERQYSWTSAFGERIGCTTPISQASDAYWDLAEVAKADVVLAILDDTQYAYRGTFTEIGYGLGRGKKVIIVCPGMATGVSNNAGATTYTHHCMTNVFFWHPQIIRCSNMEEALVILGPPITV